MFSDSLIWLSLTFRCSKKLKARINHIKEALILSFVCWTQPFTLNLSLLRKYKPKCAEDYPRNVNTFNAASRSAEVFQRRERIVIAKLNINCIITNYLERNTKRNLKNWHVNLKCYVLKIFLVEFVWWLISNSMLQNIKR